MAAHDLAGDHPQVVSAWGPTVRIRNRYLPRLHAAAAHDPVLATAVPHVTGLDPPTALCAPTVSHAYCCDAGRGRFLSTMEEHR